jgi:acyl carrier protein
MGFNNFNYKYLDMKIKEKVIEILKAEKNSGLHFEKLNESVSLLEQGLDSLGKITLFFNIDEFYNILTTDEEVDNANSILEIVKLIENQLEKKN